MLRSTQTSSVARTSFKTLITRSRSAPSEEVIGPSSMCSRAGLRMVSIPSTKSPPISDRRVNPAHPERLGKKLALDPAPPGEGASAPLPNSRRKDRWTGLFNWGTGSWQPLRTAGRLLRAARSTPAADPETRVWNLERSHERRGTCRSPLRARRDARVVSPGGGEGAPPQRRRPPEGRARPQSSADPRQLLSPAGSPQRSSECKRAPASLLLLCGDTGR